MPKRRAVLPAVALFAICVACRGICAADVEYVRDVKPLLAAKCSACHGALKQESNLRLDAGKMILQGGDGGEVVAAGNSAKSPLIDRVSSADPDFHMPPEGEGEPLAAAEIDLLRRWIDAGATFPADETIPANPRDHWAYQVPVRAEVPRVADPAWQENPVDAFLAARHEEHKLARVATAPPHVLLRRIYLDLIGLPPTRAQIAEFDARIAELRTKDPLPKGEGDLHSAIRIPQSAIDAVVNELLARPQYGERWGRHWMDVWRYSDWSGYGNEIRNSQRHIWRWRDWIVASLNDDKPYDRMIVEMLAGDEAEPANPDTLRATGFLARNWYKFNRHAWLDNTVEHTAKAFLGMTVNCAKCHDHKYDPIAQAQYYQFRAIFEPHDIRTDPIAGESDLNKDGLPRAYDKDLTAATYLFERGNEKRPVKDKSLAPGVPNMLGVDFDIAAVDLPVEGYYPALREEQINAQLAEAQAKVQAAQQQLQQQSGEDAASQTATLKQTIAERSLAALQARIAADRAKHFGLADDLPPVAQAAAQAEKALAVAEAELAAHTSEKDLAAAKRQAAEKPDEKKAQEAAAGAEKKLAEAKDKLSKAEEAPKPPGEKYTPLGVEFPRTSSGRRLALAKWIVDRDNPLTARVAVNHIWLRHFGSPLVENVFDFGLQSPRPEHAELLDWLAVELMEHDWKMKHIHRLIVTSQAYRLSSSLKDAPQQSIDADPDNRLYWRMNARRLEAEAVRDSLLAAAGNLDVTLGGPDIDENQAQTSRRRSIYLRHAYEKKSRFLELFDAANETDCYRRTESIIPQQALALANSQLCLEQSRLLAGKLAEAAADRKIEDRNVKEQQAADEANDAFIALAFEAVLCRQPTDDELRLCREFLTQQAQRLAEAGNLTAITGGPNVSVAPAKDPTQRARENLVHVLMNHNDFLIMR